MWRKKSIWWFYWTCSTMSQMFMESLYIQLYSIFIFYNYIKGFPIPLTYYILSYKSLLQFSEICALHYLKRYNHQLPSFLLNVFQSSLWVSSKLFSRFWVLVHIWIYITLQPDLWHKKQFDLELCSLLNPNFFLFNIWNRYCFLQIADLSFGKKCKGLKVTLGTLKKLFDNFLHVIENTHDSHC